MSVIIINTSDGIKLMYSLFLSWTIRDSLGLWGGGAAYLDDSDAPNQHSHRRNNTSYHINAYH